MLLYEVRRCNAEVLVDLQHLFLQDHTAVQPYKRHGNRGCCVLFAKLVFRRLSRAATWMHACVIRAQSRPWQRIIFARSCRRLLCTFGRQVGCRRRRRACCTTIVEPSKVFTTAVELHFPRGYQRGGCGFLRII